MGCDDDTNDGCDSHVLYSVGMIGLILFVVLFSICLISFILLYYFTNKDPINKKNNYSLIIFGLSSLFTFLEWWRYIELLRLGTYTTQWSYSLHILSGK